MVVFPEPSPGAGRGEREKIWTVTEITLRIKQTLETQIGRIWVCGEISNLRTPRSGHSYFTLKDKEAQLAAVLFAGVASRIRFHIEDGLEVEAFGRVTVYPPSGNYQIVLEQIKPRGKGELQVAFEQLKAKLEARGWFDPRRKKPIPLLPSRIGIVTSPTGAAIRDMINVMDRRFGRMDVLLVPVKVQGEGAAQEIAAALRLLNARNDVDVIIVGRGGGSIEDLWAFNEEVVAQAIFESKIPVVSGVGHEIDFTIADFVADLRAPTPSAAAELVVPDRAKLVEKLDALRNRTALAWTRRIAVLRTRIDGLAARPVLRDPMDRVRVLTQRLDDLQGRLPVALVRRMEHVRERLDALRARPAFDRPFDLIRLRRAPLADLGMRLARCGTAATTARRTALAHLQERLAGSGRTLLAPSRERLKGLAALLDGLSPLRVLGRGYTLTKRTTDGRILRSIFQVRPGDHLLTVFPDGEAKVWVEGVKPGGEPPRKPDRGKA